MSFDDNRSGFTPRSAFGQTVGGAGPTPVLAPDLELSSASQQPWAPSADVASQYQLPLFPVARLKGFRPTEFRQFVLLTLNEMGIVIEGKAIPTGGAFIVSYMFLGLIITEFAMRRQKSLPIPWGDVEAVRLDPATRTGVIGYHLPGKPKARFSVGFKLPDPMMFDQLERTTRGYLPGKVEEGPIKKVNTAVVVLIALAIVIALVIIAALLPPDKH